MKQNEIQALPKLNRECFENLFNVYQTNDGMHYYNLLQTIVFPDNLPESLFTKHIISYEDTWPLISYNNYKTPNLWWVLMFANKISNPTKKLKNGDVINVPIMDLVQEILAQISK